MAGSGEDEIPSTAHSASSERTISTRADGAWITGSGRPETADPVTDTGLKATVPIAEPAISGSISSAGASPRSRASSA
jgi:hypothetical protein